MVNFADAVTKVSYGKLRTTTPNAKGVEKFLHNVALTNTKPLGGLPSLMAEDAMYSMGAKAPTFKLRAFIDHFGSFEPSGDRFRTIVNKIMSPIIHCKPISEEAYAEAHKKASESMGLIISSICK